MFLFYTCKIFLQSRIRLGKSMGTIGKKAMLQDEACFELSRPDVVKVARSKGRGDEHYALLDKWLDTHGQITLQEYANLTGTSVATASRELKSFSANPEYGILSIGSRHNRCWVRNIPPLE